MASTSKTSNKVTGYLKKIVGLPVGELYILSSNEAIIGRNRQSAHICIQDPNVSRKHCVLRNTEIGWFIQDLKSVNGTYVDGKVLNPDMLYALKDDALIYLGPPGEAPVAFIFSTKQGNERFNGIDVNGLQSSVALDKIKNCLKRRADPEAPNTNENSSQRKRIVTTSPTLVNLSLRFDDGYNGSVSDCSISSLDSLRTRVRKISAKKEKKRNPRTKDSINAASTSASPNLRTSSNVSSESKPSTSALPVEKLEKKRNIAKKPVIPKEYALLNTLFTDSEKSPETIKEDDSQSLLNDSKILIECEPYPFSQSLPTEIAQRQQCKDKIKTEAAEPKELMEEQFQKAILELKKLKKDKLYLSRLAKELRSESYLEKKIHTEFQNILDAELCCNICTEVFIQAVTLGCSHTFCEFCINEWKKKQKKCPICREKIVSETKILVLDSFINEAFSKLDRKTQDKRKVVISTREKTKAMQQQKNTKRSRGRGRGRQNQSSSSGSNGIQLINELLMNELNGSPSVVEIPEADLDNLSSSDFSDDSDMSVEGDGYFGGYGRCYNCGRRGHWANGCPYT